MNENRTTAYVEYMASDDWQRRRDRYTMEHDYACHRCRAHEGLQLHHRTYARLGAELDGDLCWLCESCHGIQHKILGTLDPGPAPPYTPLQQQNIGVATRRVRVAIVERYLIGRTSLSLDEARRQAWAHVYGAA